MRLKTSCNEVDVSGGKVPVSVIGDFSGYGGPWLPGYSSTFTKVYPLRNWFLLK